MPAPAAGHPALGLGLALASAAAFGTSGAFAKALLQGGWSPGAIVTLRISVAALVLLVPTVVALRGRWSTLRESAGLVVAYGLVAVAGCQLAYFSAVQHLSVGVALLLEYLAPVLLVGWLWARHRQAPRRLTLAGALLAVAGLLLVLDVLGGVRLSLVGVAWGLAAAVALVLYFLLSGRQGNLPPIALAGGGLVVGAVGLGLAGLAGVLPMYAGSARVVVAGASLPWWAPMLELAVLAGAFAYVAGIASVRLLGPKVASFVMLTEVLFAVLIAWGLLGELPTPVQLAGGSLIVAGVVAVRTDELRRARRAVPTGEPDFPVPAPVA